LTITVTHLVGKHRLIEEGKTKISLPSEQVIVEARRQIAEVRKEAIKAQVPGVAQGTNAPLIPSLREQVELIDTPETWQAYATAYTFLNSEQHIGHFSFQQSFRAEQPDGTVVHHDDYQVRVGERELGSSLYASTLAIVSDWLNLGITDEADAIRLQLVGL